MVSELCAVLQLPQSTVSRHLKTLGDAGWVASRRDGTSRYYSLAADGDEARAQIWSVTRRELTNRNGAGQDRRRLARVLARRSETSQQFFATSAGHWDRMREDLFGADFFLQALVGLLPEAWTVGDLGCGTGSLMAAVAPHQSRVSSVSTGRKKCSRPRAPGSRGLPNVELRRGALESLPLDDGALDAATMVLVLHHLAAPALALAEAAASLRPAAACSSWTWRRTIARTTGGTWATCGSDFQNDQMRRLFDLAGLSGVRFTALPRSP